MSWSGWAFSSAEADIRHVVAAELVDERNIDDVTSPLLPSSFPIPLSFLSPGLWGLAIFASWSRSGRVFVFTW